MGGRIKPMNDIEILREMLVCNDDVQVPLEQEQGKPPSVELHDYQANTTVKITGLPDDSIVIRAETFKAPCCFFKGSQGERRRADFVIVSDNGNRKRWIICIEVQKGAKKNKERSRVIAQLKGAACVVNYCQCIGKQFWKEKDFLNDYQFRFISMVHTSMDKRPTQNKSPNSSGDSPETFLRVPGKSHYFGKLV